MLSRLSACALILVALVAVSRWDSQDQPACDESRPVFGARACCDRHRVSGATALAVEAARKANLGPLALP
jgi:hypothetical protein